MTSYIVPILLLFILIYALFKKVNAYNSFCAGAKDGIKLVLDILPNIATIMLAVELMRVSGLTTLILRFLSPVFVFFGLPSELGEFILLRPFTGSGSLALLDDIYQTFGADSYVSRVASVVMGSSETVFYVSALYFSKTSGKNIGKALFCTLLTSFFGFDEKIIVRSF